MNYSPKLKKAMEEIKEVIEKYDIAALVAIHTPGFAEHYLRLDTSYSTIKQDGSGIDVYLPKVPKAADLEAVRNTANMLRLLAIAGGNTAAQTMQLSDDYDRMSDVFIQHGKSNHTPDKTNWN